MNSYVKIGVAVFGLIIASCTENHGKTVKPDKTLAEQIGGLTPSGGAVFEDLNGNTDTEKLLYLLDIPNGVKAASLIVLDTQIKSFESTGDVKSAEQLRSNRELIIQAADENIDDYIREVSKVYDEIFTVEEINYLVKVYSAPAMRKMIDTQLELQQSIIPVAESWAVNVGIRYEELLKQKAKEEN